jgi:hypothetical protein
MHDQFPVSIDLEVAMPEMDMPLMKGKKQRKVYPSLYISGASGLEDLPREGYALIHFKRRSVTLGDRDGEECCSAELEVHEIRLPEKGGGEEMGDVADAMKSLAKEKGLDVGAMEDEGDEEEMEGEAESLAGEMEDEEEEEN